MVRGNETVNIVDLITVVGRKDKDLGTILSLLKRNYANIFDDYEHTLAKLVKEYTSNINKMQQDLEHADKEIQHLLEAAEVLEKDVAETEAAKKKLAQAYEAEKEKLIEEIGWLKSELESMTWFFHITTIIEAKNKMRQYQLYRQKISNQVSSPSELLTLKEKLAKKASTIKALSLRQLKELVEEIYNSKAKFDQKCAENHLPRETMEQHLYTYLNQKYGLKNIILEYASAIYQGIKKFAIEDNDIAVFGRILRNEVDEEFRYVQKQLKETVTELLRVYLKGRYPMKQDAEIIDMLKKRMEGLVLEEEWVDIIKYMYNKDDSINVIIKVREVIRKNQGVVRKTDSPRTNVNKIMFSDFVKVLLNFQLKGHERFLSMFVKLFRQFDMDRNGILNELEFRSLLLAINSNRTPDEITQLISMMDPYNNQSITFSECVTFLSAELVRMMNEKRLNMSGKLNSSHDESTMTNDAVDDEAEEDGNDDDDMDEPDQA